MRSTTFLLLPIILGLAGAVCEGQTRAEGYVAFGMGGYANRFTSGQAVQMAAGGEAVMPQNVGVEGEIGLGLGGGDAWMTLSLDATRHFPRATNGRSAPFFTAGYTRLMAFTERSGRNGVNVGLGFKYWINRRSSLLLELRDVLFSGAGPSHVWAVRAGVGWQ